jgi:hypothetical protein
MSRTAITEFDWADGRYRFRLAFDQWIELQEKTDCGPFVLLQRLQRGDWKIQDIAESIRIGLIGGGQTPDKARTLVERYVKARPPLESHHAALAIVLAGVIGAPDGEEPGKSDAAKAQDEADQNAPMESSPLPPSTETVLPAA